MTRKNPIELSILICTIPSREAYLERLLACLGAQDDDRIEILVDSDDGPIGQKRNRLLAEATGKYIAFIDDDDLVAPNYIELVLNAISSNPDVVNMNLIMTTDGHKAERSYHNLKIDHWFEVDEPIKEGYKIYFRCPNHLNPVKTEIARSVGFPEISMGEDKDYSMRLKPLLSTEATIDQPIYFYLFRRNK